MKTAVIVTVAFLSGLGGYALASWTAGYHQIRGEADRGIRELEELLARQAAA